MGIQVAIIVGDAVFNNCAISPADYDTIACVLVYIFRIPTIIECHTVRDINILMREILEGSEC